MQFDKVMTDRPVAVVGGHCAVSASGRSCWSSLSQHCLDLQQYSSAACCERGVISAEGTFGSACQILCCVLVPLKSGFRVMCMRSNHSHSRLCCHQGVSPVACFCRHEMWVRGRSKLSKASGLWQYVAGLCHACWNTQAFQNKK